MNSSTQSNYIMLYSVNFKLKFNISALDLPCTPLLDQLNRVESEGRSTPVHRGPAAGQEASTSSQRGSTTVHEEPATVQEGSSPSSTHGNYNTLYY